jgi:hypothetical protein
MEQNAEQQNSALKGFAEDGPAWQAVVKRIKMARDKKMGITLDAEEVRVLDRALKALAAHVTQGLRQRYVPLMRMLGLGE